MIAYLSSAPTSPLPPPPPVLFPAPTNNCAYPTTNVCVQKWKPSRNTHTLHARFRTLCANFVCSVGACWQNFRIGTHWEAYWECVVGWVSLQNHLFFFLSTCCCFFVPMRFLGASAPTRGRDEERETGRPTRGLGAQKRASSPAVEGRRKMEGRGGRRGGGEANTG